MKIIVLALLLSSCSTVKPDRFWDGDCIERPDPYTDSICWGTLDMMSANMGWMALVDVRCDGHMKGYRRTSVYIGADQLQDFTPSDRCGRK